MKGGSRNFGLDVVRAISIILVLVAHTLEIGYELGEVGVQIFFILSGFLIGQILLRDISGDSSGSRLIRFWKRRWFRTLPMYYLVLIFRMVAYGNPFGWKVIVYFFFLQANFVGITLFPVSWSLVVEEWFYLFLPLIALFFFSRFRSPRLFGYFLILLIIVIFVVRWCWNIWGFGNIIFQFDCLFLGVLLALLKLYFNESYLKLCNVWIFALGFVGLITMTVLFAKAEYVPLIDPLRRVGWSFVTSMGIALMLPFMEKSAFINRTIFSLRPFRYFITLTSVLAYSLYLLHMTFYSMPLMDSYYINLFSQTALLYLACFCLFIIFEYPMMNMRDGLSLKAYASSVKNFMHVFR